MDPVPPSAARILVICWNLVGDTLLALPALASLRRLHPAAEIVVQVGPALAPLLADAGLADRWEPFSRRPYRGLAGHLRFLGLARDLRRQRFDIVIDWTASRRSALLCALTGAGRRLGPTVGGLPGAYTHRVPAAEDGVHLVDRIQASIGLLGGTAAQPGPLRPSAGTAAWVAQTLAGLGLHAGGYLAINPGAGCRSKRWPAERFAAVAAMVHARHQLPSLVVWGPGEEELARAVAAACPSARVAPASDLVQLAGLLSAARMLLSNDSGPLHLACAVGTAVAGIYSTAAPALYGPRGVPHRVIHIGGCRADCRPRDCADLPCLLGIDAPLVAKAVDDLLAELSPAAGPSMPRAPARR